VADRDDKADTEHCPCGSGKSYKNCCGRLITKGGVADSAEQLMRSRYSAYFYDEYDYLKETWHPSTRPQALNPVDDQLRWCGLSIIDTEQGQAQDQEGYVEFEAHYSINSRSGVMHERSYFLKEQGQWFYVQGQVDD